MGYNSATAPARCGASVALVGPGRGRIRRAGAELAILDDIELDDIKQAAVLLEWSRPATLSSSASASPATEVAMEHGAKHPLGRGA